MKCFNSVILLWLVFFNFDFSITKESINTSDDQPDPICPKYVEVLKGHINPAVDPCENFYEFACGNARIFNLINEQNLIDTRINSLLLNEDAKHSKNVIIKTFKKAYKQCDEGSEQSVSMRDQINDIYSAIGEWPRYSNDSAFTKTEFLLRVSKLIPIIQVLVTGSRLIISPYDSFMTSLQYLSGNFGEETVEKYFGVMIKIANLLGNKWPAVEMRHALVFGMNITKTLEGQPQTETIIKYSKIEEEFPNIPIKEIIQEFAQCCDNYTEDVQILVINYEFFKRLDNVISKTDKQSVENFIKWIIFYDFAFTSGDKQIVALLEELQPLENIKTICKSKILDWFAFPLWWLYFNKYENNSKIEATDLFYNVQRAIIDGLNFTEGLDQITKERAQDKLAAIDPKIDYPDFIKDIGFIQDFYKGLDFNYSVGELAINLKQLVIKKFQHKYGDKIDPQIGWFKLPLTMFNAAYFQDSNEIFVSQTVLDTTIYSCKQLNYIFYGTLGYVLSHEITHSIDNKGRIFNKLGKKENWWTDDAEKWFTEKSQCLIEQFNNYYWPETNSSVDGNLTLSENMADLSIKFLYDAYQSTVDPNKPEPKLIGFENYRHNQLFWIATAQIHCGENTTAELLKIPPNEHAPGRFRVIGALQNSEDFAKDFNCPEGSYMNPKEKCIFY